MSASVWTRMMKNIDGRERHSDGAVSVLFAPSETEIAVIGRRH